MSVQTTDAEVYRASAADAPVVARLLHNFNTEFDTPSPGIEALTQRLRTLLDGPSSLAYLVGEPAVGVALLTLRTNVWYEGLVALLDELYVAPDRRSGGLGTAMVRRLIADATDDGVSAIEINVDSGDVDAQRFYERQGFNGMNPDTGERAFFYSLEL